MTVFHTEFASVTLRRAKIAESANRGGLLPYLKAMCGLAHAAGNAWLAQRASSKGAALTLYVLFSLAPMLILLVSLAGLFFDEDTVRAALLTQLSNLIGAPGGDALKAIVAGTRQDASGVVANVISGAIVLVTATSAFAELKESLDELWKIPPSTDSGILVFIKERILSLGLLLVLALMLVMTLAVNAALAALHGSWTAPPGAGKALQYAFGVLTMLIVSVVFAFVYKYLPTIRIAWGDVIIGSLLTAVLFMAGKVLIGLYLGHGNFAGAYGAAGSIVALVTWMYYSAQIFFFGALFTHEYAATLGSRRTSIAGYRSGAKP
jgi:membrane protein